MISGMDAETLCGAGMAHELVMQNWPNAFEVVGTQWSCELPSGHEGEHRDSYRAGDPGHRDTEYMFWDETGRSHHT